MAQGVGVDLACLACYIRNTAPSQKLRGAPGATNSALAASPGATCGRTRLPPGNTSFAICP